MDIETAVLQATGSTAILRQETLQSLWSGYGAIKRYVLSGGAHRSVIVKHVQIPEQPSHPRGWNTARSHARKVRSFEVETHWYRHLSQACNHHCRVAQCLATHQRDGEFLMILEDLDAAGFAKRLTTATLAQMRPCIDWLARFHATFLGKTANGLWPIGTYWHLDTRPDELDALEDKALKHAAAKIDRALRDCPFQTLVHGDAKLANFCFADDYQAVAAVDFQYVGGGCGMKDLAYFIGSCLDEDECAAHEQTLLDGYFNALKRALDEQGKSGLASEIEAAWRPLFAYAWTDFHRFLKGWSPDHWKINRYSERLSQHVLAELAQQ